MLIRLATAREGGTGRGTEGREGTSQLSLVWVGMTSDDIGEGGTSTSRHHLWEGNRCASSGNRGRRENRRGRGRKNRCRSRGRNKHTGCIRTRERAMLDDSDATFEAGDSVEHLVEQQDDRLQGGLGGVVGKLMGGWRVGRVGG
jgi:hypothetical protein